MKLRTFFCLISVALGIASITVIVATTEGAYKKAFAIGLLLSWAVRIGFELQPANRATNLIA